MASDSIIPLLLLPDELITEILLKLPVKSLSKFMCVSKSWLQLISSPTFVKNHIKLTADDKGCIHHRLIFRNIDGNFKFCSLPPLFTKQQHTEELFHIERSTLSTHIVGSLNRLICVVHGQKEAYIWNPTITKSKELPKFTNGTWGSLELPICGKDNFDINLGVVGSDLSLLYTCQRGAATSDVWIMKHSGVNSHSENFVKHNLNYLVCTIEFQEMEANVEH
ncbi:F-box/kelch-repeat protein At3g06240-like [Solanum tuberosum]|uniref:F-box/kelch-repeat protein At3g06240-like n=1 Tax=Solanum tuberosum TaxID=4113 RepID=UPI00073A4C35|nr:PREDICTED: F-box/kelch-repeat protein At3g06240-like [Solanum tuberosum]